MPHIQEAQIYIIVSALFYVFSTYETYNMYIFILILLPRKKPVVHAAVYMYYGLSCSPIPSVL